MGIVLLILEILMLIVGAIALSEGKLPETLFKTLFGKGDYRTDARTARRLGALLVLPFLGLLGVMFLQERRSLQQIAGLASLLHFVLFLVILLITVRWARKIRTANQAG